MQWAEEFAHWISVLMWSQDRVLFKSGIGENCSPQENKRWRVNPKFYQIQKKHTHTHMHTHTRVVNLETVFGLKCQVSLFICFLQ